MLSRLVGPAWTKAMVLFNEELDGETAVSAGPSLRCVAPEKLVDEAKRLAAQAAKAPRELLERTKETIENLPGVLEHRKAVETEAEVQARSTTLPFMRERLDALQKQIAARSATQKT